MIKSMFTFFHLFKVVYMFILSFIAAIIFDLQMIASRRIMDAGRLVAGDGINQTSRDLNRRQTFTEFVHV